MSDDRCPHCTAIEAIQAKGQKFFTASRFIGTLSHASIGFSVAGALGLNPLFAVLGVGAHCACRAAMALIEMKLTSLGKQLEKANNEHNAVNAKQVKDLMTKLGWPQPQAGGKTTEPPLPS